MTEAWPDEHRVMLVFLLARYLTLLQACAPIVLTDGGPLAE